ncbi:PqqD family peptide modification chaperone [bacterium]|nr:PqqD family peptide modification chaperone [candidate division CSSED10-310 bacterium]
MTSENGLQPEMRIRLRPDVAIEDFERKSLILLMDSMQLREINHAARRLLSLADGRRTVGDIAEVLAREMGGDDAYAFDQVVESLSEMERHGIVVRDVALRLIEPELVRHATIMADPDVVFWHFRDNEGALLTSANGRYILINATAIEIWKILAAPVTVSYVIEHMSNIFPDVPSDEIEKDIMEFMEYLVDQRFIGDVGESG